MLGATQALPPGCSSAAQPKDVYLRAGAITTRAMITVSSWAGLFAV